MPVFKKKIPIGPILRRFREERSLTQDRVAVGFDSSRSYISQLELGKKNCTFSALIKYADALGVKPEELFIEVVKEYRKLED